jgi:hypothetical protein
MLNPCARNGYFLNEISRKQFLVPVQGYEKGCSAESVEFAGSAA